MPKPIAPFLFTLSFEVAKYSNPTFTRILTSSLSRSLFSGCVRVFRNHEMPLFKVERRQTEEIFVAAERRGRPGTDGRSEEREFLFGLGKHVNPGPRQWVIIQDAAGLALRNIDHLILTDSI
jgi:hypothetical protein